MHKLVEVTWDDAHTIGEASWIDPDEAQRQGSKPVLCTTVGFVIVDNTEVITLAGTVNYEDSELSAVNGVMCIPRGMVRKVRSLK